jgi:non-heme chloroperoxidase
VSPKHVQPITFDHGWPVSSDDWDAQLLFFCSMATESLPMAGAAMGVQRRSAAGHDMNHYAADASAAAGHLDLRALVHIGHSTGSGEVAHYVAKYG